MKANDQQGHKMATILTLITLACGAFVALGVAAQDADPEVPAPVLPLSKQELEMQVLAYDCQSAANAPSVLCSTPMTVADQTPYR